MIPANAFPLKGLGAEGFLLGGSFQPNAASAPSSTLFEFPPGFNFTVSYAATGVFTVTVPSGFTLPDQPIFIAAFPQFAVLATDWFECAVLGATTLNTTTRQFVVQAHRNGTAREIAATTGNRINFLLYTRNSTGA